MPLSSYKYKINSHHINEFLIRIAEIENPEILFDDFLKKNPNDFEIKDEQIPYWGELWPSSIALSQFLSENKKLVKGKQVIEIGCGLGLPGIVAAKSGGEVLLTDYLAAAIEFAAFNWKLNFTTEANVSLLDWRSPGKIIPADVLLASDVAYESRAFKPLLNAMKLLIKKDGIILISEPNRKFAKDFFIELKKEGFNVEEEIINVFKNGVDNKISIYKLKMEADKN